MQYVVKKNIVLKVTVAFLAAVLLFLGTHGITHAADLSATTTATVAINGGPQTISTNGAVTLPAVPLNGDQQSTTVSLPNINLTDATGTGAGWHVTVSSPAVTAGTKTLSTGLLKISPVASVTKDDPTSSSVPTVSTTADKLVDSGAVTLLSAAAGNGMGSYIADQSNLTLSVPANTYAGTYTTTLTYSLVTAP
ncbi:MAG: hypothetical protein K0Q87_150 [Neobacillus sp.]|jgi:preprotein translocase subunit SecF|nr:hypothetical protein [Neobacillus sp.]